MRVQKDGEIWYQSVESYLVDNLLRRGNRVCLEEQPKVVLEALGRFVNILLNKGLLNVEDLKQIAETSWQDKDSMLIPDEE